jgi:hypothetical protein
VTFRLPKLLKAGRKRSGNTFASLGVLVDPEFSYLDKENAVYVGANGYCRVCLPGDKEIYLHRFIVNAGKFDHVDHINRNKLDNRSSNLRKCTRSVNMHNSKIRHDNKTGVKGVWFSKRDKVYQASIHCEGKRHHLGSFKTVEDAKDAREKAEARFL